MTDKSDILTLLNQAEAAALKNSQRAVIIQPGALGDCILTLPLAHFLISHLNIGAIDFISHCQYTDYFVSRTIVDTVKSIDSIPLHKLFVPCEQFCLPDDNDRLYEVFAGYNHIISFMAPEASEFEKNLLATVNCTHSAQITSINLKPPAGYNDHIAKYYINQYLQQNNDFQLENDICNIIKNPITSIKISDSDISQAKRLLTNNSDFVLIAPGSGGREKCWHLDNFIMLAQKFQAKGIQTVFILGYAELERFSSDNIKNLSDVGLVLSDLTIPQILGLGALCIQYIGNDSGISHLLATAAVKTLAIFCPTNPNIYSPIGINSKAISIAPDFWSKSEKAVEFVLKNIS